MSLYKIVRSKFYKNFMAKLYGIGASIVITGALFKILHWNGADITLMIGMFTEAVIFFCSAFEPLHKEYDWALVYPELGVTGEDGKPYTGSPTQQLDKMLSEAKIGPELIASLASGMKNLSDNANKLSHITDAASATEGYVANLTKAKNAVENLTGVYEKSADAMVASSDMQSKSMQEMVDKQKEHALKLQGTLSSTTDMQIKSTQEMFDVQKQHAQKLQEKLTTTADIQIKSTQEMFDAQKQHAQKLQEKLTTTADLQVKNVQEIFDAQKQQAQKLNEIQMQSTQKIGQIQEQGAQVIIDNYKKIQDSSATFANAMNESIADAQKFKQEVDKMSKNVAHINAIYANMLAAMTTK